MFDSINKSLMASFEGMDSPEDLIGETPQHVARRARYLTERSRMSSRTFAVQRLGVSPARWNWVENHGQLSTAMAKVLIAKIPGVTWEWLRTGRDPLHLMSGKGTTDPGKGTKTAS